MRVEHKRVHVTEIAPAEIRPKIAAAIPAAAPPVDVPPRAGSSWLDLPALRGFVAGAFRGAVAAAILATGSFTAGDRSDDVILVGMNAHNTTEIQKMRERGVHVIAIQSESVQGRARAPGSGLLDLTKTEDIQTFVAAFHLDEKRAAALERAITSTSPWGRDELAKLAHVFHAPATPSRLILSGHFVGAGVCGEDNGTLEWAGLRALSEAFPEAARSIEDLHISACYSGGEWNIEQYRQIFPALKTIWAYAGTAPGSATGAVTHEARWERATRGRATSLSLLSAALTKKSANVAVWSADKGYRQAKARPSFEDACVVMKNAEPFLARCFAGKEAAPREPLRAFYASLQSMLQGTDVPDNVRPKYELLRAKTVRLIYYQETVAPKFAATHAETIASAYVAAGLQCPAFATLDRASALQAIAELEAAGGSAAGLDLLRKGLVELDPEVIPEAWL